MMLRYIIVFGLISLALTQSTNNSNKSTKKQSEVKYMKSATAIDLKKQQFQSTKERPELNPVLSALINEDIKKSIDAKRHAEFELAPSSSLSQQTTQAPVQTTVKYIPKAHDDLVVVDSEAGSSSEKKQTSRIEIKQGPNGMDYEYEYVYYYYDDDDEKTKKLSSTSSTADDKTITNSNVGSGGSDSSTGGKNRYDRTNTTTKPNSFERNELQSTRGKGRQSIPVVEETSEERLPVNTRFPPRSTITPNVQVLSNINETTKRTSIKRPSLELVDSQSFNRGDKGQSKSRIFENEFTKINDIKSNENVAIVQSADDAVALSNAQNAEINELTTITSEIEEPTTQIMDKVALDLYAHLANENSNIDSTFSTVSDEFSTPEYLQHSTTEEFTTAEVPTTAFSLDKFHAPKGAQPINISELLKAVTTTSTTTTTTTTTKTTTTTEAPPSVGRRAPFGNARNRPKTNRSKPTIETKQPEEEKEITSSESSVTKPKNRFSRPSFGARSRPTQSTTAPHSEEESFISEKTKLVASTPAARGRTRNRFNLRASTPIAVTADEKNPDENAIDATSSQVTSTQRSLRTRPTFNLRGRSRATSSSTAASSPADNNESTEIPINNVNNNPSTESALTSANLKPSSRFNLRRPNQLLASRGRLSPLAKNPAPPAEQTLEIINSTDIVSPAAVEPKVTNILDESEQVAAEPSTTPQTGLNRLRNRPRIQIQPKASNASKPPTAASLIANRKANPLISRRKPIGSSTTTEESIVTDGNETSDEDEKEIQNEQTNDSEDEGNAKEEASIVPAVETSSEPARGLGLLANRRRLAVRRPGTKL